MRIGGQHKTRIGCSVEGRPIVAHSNFDPAATPPRPITLLIGGIHGDEPATVHVLESFVEHHLDTPRLPTPVAVIPLANPDGALRGWRYNARGVDLNRNFDTHWSAASEEPPGPAPWSEPESAALRDLILKCEPARIVSLHWALAEIDADGPQSTALGMALWNAMDETERKPYRIRVSELGRGLRRLQRAYDTLPGSLGQWCGYGVLYRNGTRPAVVTLELPFDPGAEDRPHPLPPEHLDQVRDLWRTDPEAYMAGIERPVHKMLLAACAEPVATGCDRR